MSLCIKQYQHLKNAACSSYLNTDKLHDRDRYRRLQAKRFHLQWPNKEIRLLNNYPPTLATHLTSDKHCRLLCCSVMLEEMTWQCMTVCCGGLTRDPKCLLGFTGNMVFLCLYTVKLVKWQVWW